MQTLLPFMVPPINAYEMNGKESTACPEAVPVQSFSVISSRRPLSSVLSDNSGSVPAYRSFRAPWLLKTNGHPCSGSSKCSRLCGDGEPGLQLHYSSHSYLQWHLANRDSIGPVEPLLTIHPNRVDVGALGNLRY